MLATPREMKRRLSRSEMERGVANFVKFYTHTHELDISVILTRNNFV